MIFYHSRQFIMSLWCLDLPSLCTSLVHCGLRRCSLLGMLMTVIRMPSHRQTLQHLDFASHKATVQKLTQPAQNRIQWRVAKCIVYPRYHKWALLDNFSSGVPSLKSKLDQLRREPSDISCIMLSPGIINGCYLTVSMVVTHWKKPPY